MNSERLSAECHTTKIISSIKFLDPRNDPFLVTLESLSHLSDSRASKRQVFSPLHVGNWFWNTVLEECLYCKAVNGVQ